MKVEFVDLKKQYHEIKTEIDSAISNVLESANFIGGEHVDQFEVNFRSLIGTKHCISVANGTDSLFIIFKMLGIGPGDEVLVPAITWISSSETISLTGAKPVFVDIENDYYTLNTEDLQKKITKNTKAILAVHLYGQSCDMDSLQSISEEKNLILIEDCAQSHLAQFKGKSLGSFGAASSFSFYPGKNLGAYGDAGCILTDNDQYENKFRLFARHGAIVKHNHVIEGMNSRLDSIQAAVLNVKMKYLAEWNKKRLNVANIYQSELSDILQISLPLTRPNTLHAFHLYVIRTEYRDELSKYLKESGISTAIHYPTALPFLEAYKMFNHSYTDFPVASKVQNEILSLPMHPNMSTEEIMFVVQSIKDFFKKKQP